MEKPTETIYINISSADILKAGKEPILLVQLKDGQKAELTEEGIRVEDIDKIIIHKIEPYKGGTNVKISTKRP